MFKKLKLRGIPSLNNRMWNSLYTNRTPLYSFKTSLFIVLLGLIFTLMSCSSAEKALENVTIQSVKSFAENAEISQDAVENFNIIENTDISNLPVQNALPQINEPNTNELELPDLPLLDWSDFYANLSHGIPDELSANSELESTESIEKNLYEGFRIQIYSGPSPSTADTVAKEFRTWSIQYITGYSPETYTFFKAPYYRVHVGDFHDRTRAYSTSQIIKRQFPDAWVVYDRVVPWNVPADSALIRFQRN